MASLDEMNKFVKKFVSLWKSGSNARLHVETEAGVAHVSLHVSLGQVQPSLSGGQHGGGCRRGGGSPAKHRRRECREAERKVSNATEEAADDENADRNESTAGQVVVKEDKIAEKSNENNIPQKEKCEPE